MKITIDTKKGAEAVSNFLQKTSDLGKKTVSDVQASANDLSEKMKQDSYQRRLKKYNPLFPDVYHSEAFNLPNMIMIRDDAERKGIDVCDGAIGWLGNESGMEVLYLYDEFVSECGITFIPSADCDAVYYVDSFNRNRFIRIDCIFNKAHEERLAELEHVAYCLGAKSCTVEICESSLEVNVSKKKASVGGDGIIRGVKVSSKESAEQDISAKSTAQRTGKNYIQMEGHQNPRRPELKWFADDNTIKNLIESRCSGEIGIKRKTFELSGSSSATMSQKTACAIDNAVGAMKLQGSSTMEAQAIRENRSTLYFSIEF